MSLNLDVLEEDIKLQTERILLRKPYEKDIQDIFEYGSDEEVTKYVRFKTHKNLTDAKTFLVIAKNGFKNKTALTLVIELKSENKVIGAIDFKDIDDLSEKAELGFILSRKYWSKGFMSEACRKFIGFGFKKIKLNRIEAHVDIENVRSIKLLKDIMQKEGMLRECEKKNGKYINMNLYSILKREYILRKV